jgi:antitoxin HigA-1
MLRIPTHGPPTHPGEMLLEEFLKPLGLSQTELADRMGVSYPRVNELIHGRRGVTPDTALRLERLFGMEAQFWLNLQMAWDLYHATRSAAAKKIRKIKPISTGERILAAKRRNRRIA